MSNSLYRRYLASLSPITRAKQEGQLKLLCEELSSRLDTTADPEAFEWWSLSALDLELLQQDLLAKGYRPSSVRCKLMIVRSLLKRAYAEGYMTERSYAGLTLLKHPPAVALGKTGRALSVTEVRDIVDQLDLDTSRGRLEAAVFLVLATTGLRVRELCLTNAKDLKTNGRLKVLHGKGQRQREVVLSAMVNEIVQRHMADHVTGCVALMQGTSKGQVMGRKYRTGRLDPHAVEYILYRLARKAGIEKFSPHDLRRTVASHMLGEGVDVVTVADVLGHASLDTTRMYDRRSEHQKEAAFNTLAQTLIGDAHV
jgi:integrase/recombinase XerD